MTKILSIASQAGQYKISMEALGTYVSKTYGPNSNPARKFGFLVRENSIAFKTSVIPDFIPDYDHPILFTENDPNPSTSDRMKVFNEEAIKISTSVALIALERACLASDEITHIITTSCTGMTAPGLEIQLTQTLSLNQNVVRYGINFMGCYAAFHAIKLADTIIKSNHESKVLVICTELCSLHYRKDESDDNILSTYLFSDGCAAAVLSSDSVKQTGLSVLDTHAVLIAEGQSDMAWHVGNNGFEMVLSKNIPLHIKNHLSSHLQDFLSKNKIKKEEINKYAIHPGGKNILKAFESAIGLDQKDLEESYAILAKYGNMSSATVLFVLEKMFYEEEKDGLIYAAAFGPGLTVEGALFKKTNRGHA
ncbi:MAG TPA: type III polyketide synthase [Saprospiraceae bacterium]|nr:type III polyketide synthase [Saprospiraceae bacterium]